jgi:hypothetical protein
MSRNDCSQSDAKDTPDTARDNSHQTADPQWEQMVSELRACCNSPSEDLDEMAIARYLSGECSDKERKDIEQAIGRSPDLTDCVVLAREVLDDMEPAA